jgi:hypothetical protein
MIMMGCCVVDVIVVVVVVSNTPSVSPLQKKKDTITKNPQRKLFPLLRPPTIISPSKSNNRMYYSARLFLVSFLLLILKIQASQAAYPPQYIRSEIVNPASRVNNHNHDSTDNKNNNNNNNNKMNTNSNNNSYQTVRKVSGSQPVRSTTSKKYY